MYCIYSMDIHRLLDDLFKSTFLFCNSWICDAASFVLFIRSKEISFFATQNAWHISLFAIFCLCQLLQWTQTFFSPHVGQWFVWYMTRSFKLKELEVLIEEKISRSHFNPDEARFSWHLSTFSFQATVIHSDVLLYFQFSVRILIIVIEF